MKHVLQWKSSENGRPEWQEGALLPLFIMSYGTQCKLIVENSRIDKLVVKDSDGWQVKLQLLSPKK